MTDRKRQIDGLFEDGGTLQAGEIARRLGVTRQTAHRYLRKLVSEGRLVTEGAGRSRRYRRSNPIDSRTYPTADLAEDRVWTEMSGMGSVVEDLPRQPKAVLHYALTEVVNNAIDHSGSSEVRVKLARRGECVALVVRDEGVGIFRHIRDKLGLATELEALQDLSKGKTTTMPSRHTGEGIFFTSKAANRFEIESGSLRWIVDNRRNDMAVGNLDHPVQGTVVRVEVDIDNAHDIAEVFAQFTEDFEFSKTRTVIRLFAYGTEFVSRSEAKRLVRGLEKFREVVVDFEGVDLVGQGFADEVFRVWAMEHPEVALIPTGMSDAIAFMVERAIRVADPTRSPSTQYPVTSNQ
jgi:anti-sigma regulatory factor (Ser/Thr protein kinase)